MSTNLNFTNRCKGECLPADYLSWSEATNKLLQSLIDRSKNKKIMPHVINPCYSWNHTTSNITLVEKMNDNELVPVNFSSASNAMQEIDIINIEHLK